MIKTETFGTNLAKYILNYRKRFGLNKQKMGVLLDISPTSITRLEKGNSDGLALKTLILLAGLEFDSLASFMQRIESSKIGNLSLTDLDKNLLDLFNSLDKSKVLDFLEVSNHISNDHLVGNRFKWMIELAIRILKGNDKQVREIEEFCINYYINNIASKDDEAHRRFISLMRDKFSLDR